MKDLWDSRLALTEDALLASREVKEYARIMQRARISFGSADWRERLRWHLHLGPAKWHLEAAQHHFEMANR